MEMYSRSKIKAPKDSCCPWVLFRFTGLKLDILQIGMIGWKFLKQNNCHYVGNRYHKNAA